VVAVLHRALRNGLPLHQLHHPDPPHVGDAVLGHLERLEKPRQAVVGQAQRRIRLLGPLRRLAA
jgi:hypothetical protein